VNVTAQLALWYTALNGRTDAQDTAMRSPAKGDSRTSGIEDAPVHIVEYDPAWPSRFERERELLAVALQKWTGGPIEHVGSTAVPGLPAKPVIDILVAVVSLDASRDALSALAPLGYLYYPYHADIMHWFCKPSPSFRTHHLHLVPFSSRLWTERLLFRDHLRRNPMVAAEYAELKRRLAKEYEFDREAYTEAKGPFIQHVLDVAYNTTV
jgi:GrpB-like predicted nucleotidyltransferase (UPF0157 family)